MHRRAGRRRPPERVASEVRVYSSEGGGEAPGRLPTHWFTYPRMRSAISSSTRCADSTAPSCHPVTNDICSPGEQVRPVALQQDREMDPPGFAAPFRPAAAAKGNVLPRHRHALPQKPRRLGMQMRDVVERIAQPPRDRFHREGVAEVLRPDIRTDQILSAAATRPTDTRFVSHPGWSMKCRRRSAGPVPRTAARPGTRPCPPARSRPPPSRPMSAERSRPRCRAGPKTAPRRRRTASRRCVPRPSRCASRSRERRSVGVTLSPPPHK